jgi:two-component system nitrate/nitrite sensor histidine kinase NarX
MEDTTEAKILVMRVVLGVALILTVLVVLLTIWLIHTHLVQPLKSLLALSSSVGQGDLSVRAPCMSAKTNWASSAAPST